MKKTFTLGLGLGLAVLGGLMHVNVQAEPLQLAILSNVDGKILVNKGKGFISAKSGMALQPGDRVIALDGANAAVVYPDGCVTKLGENSLLALDKSATCSTVAVKTGAAQQPLRYAQAIGGTMTDAGGGGGGGTTGAPAGSTGGTVGPTGVAGGITATQGLIGGLIFTGVVVNQVNNNNNDHPVSPF